MAKVQKLKVSLEEAKEDLKDTEYDRWHDDQNEMLDNLADEVEDFWEQIMNDLRKDINGSLDKLMQMVTDNPDAIARALDALGLGDALSIITTYNPDGTHTDKAIDYGGNSYESTYNEDGENTANTFRTEYEKLHSAIDDLYSSTEEAVRKAAEEAERLALEESKKKEEEAKKKADSEAAERMKKEDAVRAADKRADSIMKQSADGVKSFVIDSVPMEGVQAAVEDFLNSSALHKPTTEAGKNRMKTDPLLKYIAEKYKGKTLSNANEARLGAYLGIPVKDMNNVTTSEANKILKAFQNAGFAKGGVADTLNKAASENGDDGLITIQRGEAVLTKEETEAVQTVADHLVKIGLPYTDEQLNTLRAHLNMPIDCTGMMPKSEITPVNNTNTTSVNMGDINVHLDGSGVTDMESMFEQLSKPVNRQRMTQCVLGDPKNPFQSILGKF